MHRLCCHITIGTLDLNFAHEIRVESGWETGTDTASITLPRRLVIMQGNLVKEELSAIVAPLFKRGQKVIIRFGYETPKTVFEGYVTRVHTKTPVVIECEDEMWKLKQKSYSRTWPQFKIETLIPDLLAGTGVKFQLTAKTPQGLGQLRIKGKPNVVEVLDLLRDQYNIQSFFRDGTLYVGEPYVPSLRKEVDVAFNKHVVNNGLIYRNKEDSPVTVEVTTTVKHKKSTAVAKGSDADGSIVRINRFDLQPSQLQAEADRLLPFFKYDGYEGSMTLFGEPFVKHGYVVNLFDPEIPDNRGKYYVDTVRHEFGMNGVRQIVALGPLVQ